LTHLLPAYPRSLLFTQVLPSDVGERYICIMRNMYR
jgi:hypothetical protein